MSVSRPARCLLSLSNPHSRRVTFRSRHLHTSSNLHERQRPKFANTKAPVKKAEDNFKPYSGQEKEALSQRYTPEQIAAIEAGEQAIDVEDLNERGVIRTDLGSLSYLDDFSHTRPMVDRAQYRDKPWDPKARLMSEDEAAEEFLRVKKELGANAGPLPVGDPKSAEYQKKVFPSRVDVMKIEDRMSLMMGSNGAIPNTGTYRAPGLPRKFFDDDEGKKSSKKADGEDEADPRDPDGLYNKLIKQSGLTLDEIMAYRVKILVQHRVVNQTRLGKIASMYCLACAGNGEGRLGIGEAKGQEIEETQVNARIAAIRNMQPIPRYEERTIYGDVEGKVSAVEVKLMSRPPGFGLRCQHLIFEMARAAGLHDLAARVPRSRNKMNTVKATYQALFKQRIPDEIARGRGKKLVDVRKVYYGGRV